MPRSDQVSCLRAGPLVLAALLATAAGPIAAQVPFLTGTVEVGLAAGTLRADVCLDGVPLRGDSTFVLLHRALTPKHVRDGGGAPLPHSTRAELDGVALVHVVTGVAEGARVCIDYVGAFPVYDVASADYRPSDGSSVVAFNGRTVRARGETRWYPTPHEPGSGRTHDALRYRLRVACDECDRIYLNGAPPAAGPSAELASDSPREVLLFAGDYPHRVVDGVDFLGEAVAEDTARRFIARMAEVQDFHARYLGSPYGESLDVLRIVPVRFDRPGQFWGFFSDPALGLVGLTIAQFVEILGDADHPARPLVLGALAHELAHRYFAGGLAAESSYFPLFSEPFATFLDLKATHHFHGHDAYAARVRSLAEEVLAQPQPTPLDVARADELAADDYRYRYAPLLLLALERFIGEPRMRELLRQLVIAPAAERAAADYAFLRTAAERAGVSAAEWRRWEAACLRPPFGQNRCLQDFRDTAVAD